MNNGALQTHLQSCCTAFVNSALIISYFRTSIRPIEGCWSSVPVPSPVSITCAFTFTCRSTAASLRAVEPIRRPCQWLGPQQYKNTTTSSMLYPSGITYVSFKVYFLFYLAPPCCTYVILRNSLKAGISASSIFKTFLR